MAKDESGTTWTNWPLFGAVGAGRSDELLAPPASFGLTPSGQAEQDTARNEEVPGAGPELPREGDAGS
jgi:hypothetical protein